ncbi:hypothetical protein OEZ86_009428 [Tetradesmus obliquus]|nr:hypothetical protein OEZ86_009428 [Tetradesmus obliquus]
MWAARGADFKQQRLPLLVLVTAQHWRVSDPVPGTQAAGDTLKAALAQHVFKVPVGQVTIVSEPVPEGPDSSKLLATYSATGPASNNQSVVSNCHSNTAGSWQGVPSSRIPEAKKQVRKAARARYGIAAAILQATCADG